MLILVPSSIGLVDAADVRKRYQHEVGSLPGLAELPVLTSEGFISVPIAACSLPSSYHHPQRRFGGRSRLNARPMIAARSS